MNITILGAPRTKKNSPRIVRNRLLPSAAYCQYEADAIIQIPSVVRMSIATPVNVCMVYYMPTHHVVDLSNLQNATLDILVKARVLLDDNMKIVKSHNGSKVEYDRENPRCEITITEVTT